MLSNTKSNTAEVHIWNYFYFLQRKKLVFIRQRDPSCSGGLFSSSSRAGSRGWDLNPAGVQSVKPWYCGR